MPEEQQAANQTAASEGSLLDAIMEETSLKPQDDGYDVAKKGVETFIANIIQNAVTCPQRIGKNVVRVLLHPAAMRVMEFQFLLPDRQNVTFRRKNNGAGTCRSLVNRQQIFHLRLLLYSRNP